MSTSIPPSAPGSSPLVSTTKAHRSTRARPSSSPPHRHIAGSRKTSSTRQANDAGHAGVCASNEPQSRPGPGSLEPRTRNSQRSRGEGAPAVRGSFVVSIESSAEGDSGIITRIQPAEQAASTLAGRGFLFSDAVLNVVSDLLVELIRSEEGEEEP